MIRGLSAEDAADAILLYDGRDYALRREYRGGWRLYVTRFSRNAGGGSGGMVDTTIYSAATTEAEAWRDIAQQVLSADWPGYPRVVQESSGVPPPIGIGGNLLLILSST